VAGTIDTINGLVNRRVLTKEDADAWLRAKLQAISKQIQHTNQDDDPILYQRLDAQLELIMELLNEDKVIHG
jgi:putative SOS response-associated peptidase YedK